MSGNNETSTHHTITDTHIKTGTAEIKMKSNQVYGVSASPKSRDEIKMEQNRVYGVSMSPKSHDEIKMQQNQVYGQRISEEKP